MKRWDVINLLAEKYKAESYLEIGVRTGDAFDRIKVKYKIGVDPDPKSKARYIMTSDQFFQEHSTFAPDIAFIDGMHTAEQVYRDVENVRRANPSAIVVIHDCLPIGAHTVQAVKPANSKPWNGTVWQAWRGLRVASLAFCVDCDHGCGVIVPNPRPVINYVYRSCGNDNTLEHYLSCDHCTGRVSTKEFIQWVKS